MNTTVNPDYFELVKSRYNSELTDNCIDFWWPRAFDHKHGGFLHCFDRDGTIVDTDKSVWAQGRMAWMLLTLYLEREKKGEWLDWASNGLGFIQKFCLDDTDGRLYFHVTRDGLPIRKRRYSYSESFASIAYAAHYKATGCTDSLNRAQCYFKQFVDWNFTPNLMPPKFTDTRKSISLGPRMIAIVTAQELIKCLGEDPFLKKWIDICIAEIRDLFYKPDEGAIMETVTPVGCIIDHFDGRIINPGHGIEASWFIMEEGRRRNSVDLIELGIAILDCCWKRGWDTEFGGIFYFRDVYEKPVQEYWHSMKFWWVHDEALIASLYAYRLSGKEQYRKMHEDVWTWSKGAFGDPEYGEWFGYCDRSGRPTNSLKGSLWKSFFHHPRALHQCIQICS